MIFKTDFLLSLKSILKNITEINIFVTKKTKKTEFVFVFQEQLLTTNFRYFR